MASATTRFVVASISVTVPPRALATQARCPSTAIATGSAPTGKVWMTSWVLGLMRITVLSPLLATQTEPAP